MTNKTATNLNKIFSPGPFYFFVGAMIVDKSDRYFVNKPPNHLRNVFIGVRSKCNMFIVSPTLLHDKAPAKSINTPTFRL